MRTFLIKVNGQSYEVEVEELTGAQAFTPAAKAAAPVAPAQAVQAVAPAAQDAPAKNFQAPEGAAEVHSPLPGTVLAVLVSPGDTVARGDVLVKIEAMKMENEIMSPREGKVLFVAAGKDDSVNTGDLLLVIG